MHLHGGIAIQTILSCLQRIRGGKALIKNCGSNMPEKYGRKGGFDAAGSCMGKIDVDV